MNYAVFFREITRLKAHPSPPPPQKNSLILFIICNNINSFFQVFFFVLMKKIVLIGMGILTLTLSTIGQNTISLAF